MAQLDLSSREATELIVTIDSFLPLERRNLWLLMNDETMLPRLPLHCFVDEAWHSLCSGCRPAICL